MLQGKKVALVDVTAEATSRRIVEVALVNQLIKNGTFILISKQDVDAARGAVDQDPRDWKGIARRAGADYALRANVLQFDAVEHKGYSERQVEDSQLEAETGNGKTQQVYPVKSLDGHVRIQLEFTDLAHDDGRSAVAEAQDLVTSEGKDEAIHLPPRMSFLETLTNRALASFFTQYN